MVESKGLVKPTFGNPTLSFNHGADKLPSTTGCIINVCFKGKNEHFQHICIVLLYSYDL